MKKITTVLSLLLLLVSCYKDQGNYDYTLDSMNEIRSVTFTPSVVKTAEGDAIEVQQALDESSRRRRIDAIVEQTLATSLDNLEFYWCRTYTDEQGKGVIDTIRTKGYLEFDLPVGKAMSYSIFLQIYDTSTTLSHYAKFAIKTRPIFKNSLFVLHGSEGSRQLGNIEVIGGDTKVYTDISNKNIITDSIDVDIISQTDILRYIIIKSSKRAFFFAEFVCFWFIFNILYI